MSGEPQDIARTSRGRYRPGFNTGLTKRMRIAARLEELRAEYDPDGNASAVDQNRLKLAAMHYVIAETARDPTVSVRSTRTAEYLLNKLRPPSAPRPLTTARELLDRLGNGS